MSLCTRRLALLAIVLAGAPGCVSMVDKSRGIGNTPAQRVEVTSEPAGATVRLDGIVVGVTPARVPVRRTSPRQTLIIEKPGYESSAWS